MKTGSKRSSTWTRRKLLLKAGVAGGSSAVYGLATHLGWLPESSAYAASDSDFTRFEAAGCDLHVVVIGAGISGLVTAYELERAGCKVTVLEAAHRAGGRNLTARRGTLIDELGAPQRCAFDEHPDLYFNCGPARIPGTHKRVLNYCRDFRIPLSNFVNDNPNAYVYSKGFNGGRPMPRRQYLADAKGFIAEMALKSTQADQLDTPLSAEDEERLRAFLGRFGDLNQSFSYEGSVRAGFTEGGTLRPGIKRDTCRDINELLRSPYWQFPMYFTELEDQFPSMMTPVGGMDRLVHGFVKRIGSPIRLGAVVQKLRVHSDRVEVNFIENNIPQTLKADVCFNCMPGHLVCGLDHNLPNNYRELLLQMSGVKLTKVGLQMKHRFWEEEEIYGGISWTDEDWLQIWYPSHGIHSQKGILLGGYAFGSEANDRLSRMSPQDRINAAITMGEVIHPGRYRSSFETGITISWQRYNYMLGCGSAFANDSGWARDAEKEKNVLRTPVHGRYYMIGDQMSFRHGWQEGAIGTAHAALNHLQAYRRNICA